MLACNYLIFCFVRKFSIFYGKIFSNNLNIVGNKEIGLKSVTEVGRFILGIGIICDCFSIFENVSLLIHLLYNFVSMVPIIVFDNLMNL